MTKLIIYVSLLLCLTATKVLAQNSFENKAKAIALQIERVTNEQKIVLKSEVEAVNAQLEEGVITRERAEEKKIVLAQINATIIEKKVNVYYEELRNLVQNKVDNGIVSELDTIKPKSVSFRFLYGKDEIKENIKNKDSIRLREAIKRNSTEIVLAVGFNNLVTNNSVANSDYKYYKSQFFEWGFTFNYRLLKESNLLHLKYGVTGFYSELHPTDNRYFVRDGSETKLEVSSFNLDQKKSYFKNVYLTIPVFLEFDFSKKQGKNGLPFFKSHQGIRFGIGSYVGFRTNSKQFLVYEDDGLTIKEKQKGNFNTQKINYGLSTYIGYKATSLYLKYDLNPLFKDNLVKQNNVSLGVRFDFN
ncbi:hypothetical protein HNQ02_000330 [Flavobacterium sp. 7E]|uniref:hypothetical protein n=1 Tax=Flavobacterium sp. 7E TaxID=2735898 RepID=UPI00156EF9ED|nr:hypothetical protein [Flavobacterium sp. 7E]NRS87430.1 hypothetical protein [Flavobacterium sp. 7E]